MKAIPPGLTPFIGIGSQRVMSSNDIGTSAIEADSAEVSGFFLPHARPGSSTSMLDSEYQARSNSAATLQKTLVGYSSCVNAAQPSEPMLSAVGQQANFFFHTPGSLQQFMHQNPRSSVQGPMVLYSSEPQQPPEVQLYQQLEQLTLQAPLSGSSAANHVVAPASADAVYWQHMPTRTATVPMTALPNHHQYSVGSNVLVSTADSSQSVYSDSALASYSQSPVIYGSNSEPLVFTTHSGLSSQPGTVLTYVTSSPTPLPRSVTHAAQLQTASGGRALSSSRLMVTSGVGSTSNVSGGRNSAKSTPLPALPGRFQVLPTGLQHRIINLCCANPVITVHDFDQKVVSKLNLLIDTWGINEAFAVLEQVERRLLVKQGVLRNGAGYLDVAICCHMELLKAQAHGNILNAIQIDEYAQQVLAPAVFQELTAVIAANTWLDWSHFDQGMIQLLRRFPVPGAVDKLREMTYHSFKNVDNIKGCVTSILNSKFREHRRKAANLVQQYDAANSVIGRTL